MGIRNEFIPNNRSVGVEALGKGLSGFCFGSGYPRWNADLLVSQNYMFHPSVLVNRLSGLRE